MVRRRPAAEREMYMQARKIDARIVLTALAFMAALVMAVVIPMTVGAADGPDEFSMCWTGSIITYLECVEANGGVSSERAPASVAIPAIVRDTLTDYAYMEQNTWGEDFDPTRLTTSSHFPTPDDASLTHNGIPSY